MAGGILRAPSLVDGVVVPSESERMVEPPVEPLRELLGVSRLWFTPASAPASCCTSSISGESLGFLGHRIDFHESKKDDGNWFPWHASCNHTIARAFNDPVLASQAMVLQRLQS